MNLEEARIKARNVFGDATPPSPRALTEIGRREGSGGDFFEQLTSMTPSGFPIPELLLFGLTELLDLRNEGPEEKVRWSVRFDLRASTFGFEYRKFGLRALCEPRNLGGPLAREVLGKARALTDIVEAYLRESLVYQQIEAGNFTIQNLFGELELRYQLLRQQARAAYDGAPFARPPMSLRMKDGSAWHGYEHEPIHEGSALGTAAVDAYFSRIEHVFCLALAFTSQDLPDGGIVEFLASNWPSKAKMLLDLHEPRVKSMYDRLIEIREEWRNPLAHGGFLSRGASLLFHLPGVGALPAELRRTPTGVVVRFSMENESFDAIMGLFDEFDAHLNETALRYPSRWARAGLSVAFDPASRKRYSDAMQSDEEFDALIEWTNHEIDRHMNMDY